MNNILPLLYMLSFAAAGILIARAVFYRSDDMHRLFYGLVFGLVMLIWLPTLYAFMIDFTLLAQLLALATAVAGAVIATLIYVKKQRETGPIRFKNSFRDYLPVLVAAVPILVICFILHMSHTIVTASDGSLHVGQCTYGDLCMHLGFITSISVQQTFPPMYSLLPGTQLGYPFLCDSVSSTFLTLGASLRAATILPALYACVCAVLGVYFLFFTWFKKPRTAVIATYIFFIGGGFGFWYFLNNKLLLAKEGIDRIDELMNGFYKMPTNLPAEGLRWVNAIADMLLPQRATLFGWALLFPGLSMLYRAAIDNERRFFIPLAFIAGALPLVHTHSFVALGIISAVLFISKLLSLLAARNPGQRTELALRLIGCFLVMLILAVLKKLPIPVQQEGADRIAVTYGCIAAGAVSVIIAFIALVGAVKRVKADPHNAYGDIAALGMLVLAVAVSVLTVLGVRKDGMLGLIAPLAGILAALLVALYPDDERRLNRDSVNAAAKETRKNLLFFALFGVITLILACPQLFGFTFRQSGNNSSFLRWQLNWDNKSDSYLWFYIKNLGLIFILMPIAFLNLKKEHRLFYGASLAIWAICEMLLFQPNPYDNNKLLFVWFALTCGIVANLLMERLAVPAKKLENGAEVVDAPRTAGRYLLLLIALAAIMLSGVMTLAREYVSADHIDIVTKADGKKSIEKVESGYQVVTKDLVDACEWIKANTEPDATFLTYNNHNNAVAMLTGRNLFVGSGTFLYYHGVDYQPRERLLRGLFEDPAGSLYETAREYGIDYVLIGSWERGNYSVDMNWFAHNLECVYDSGRVLIYKIN